MLPLYDHFAADAAVQACFDTGHAHLLPQGVMGLEQLKTNVAIIHLSDNTGQADDHLPPPSGTIGWDSFFHMLGRRRWQGYLVLELTDRTDAADILAGGWRWLNEMLAVMSA